MNVARLVIIFKRLTSMGLGRGGLPLARVSLCWGSRAGPDRGSSIIFLCYIWEN